MFLTFAKMTAFIKDDFWSERIRTVSTNTLPSMYKLLHETGRWDFFDFNWKEGISPHIFWDSDIAKFMEAVCFAIKYTEEGDARNLQYKSWMDDITRMTLKAQQPDGYLNTYFTQVKPTERFKNVAEEHELYCCGHLIEAAVAYHEATGSKVLVECLCRYLDLICDTFGDESGKLHGYPGHQEIELALVKLIKIVPEPRYKKLLDYFIEQRGYKNGKFYDDQARARGLDPDTYRPEGDYDHLPGVHFDSLWPTPRSYWYFQADVLVRDAQEVKGHAVRQVYFLTAVQALASHKDDDGLRTAVKRLFKNMVDKKLYIHGGIGAIARWEGFGEDHDLRWDGYSETCASIGLVLLCEKMLVDNLDREVALVMERALYNDVLGGVSVDGESYFYNQPITGEKGLKRLSWFSVSCCPPNVARLFNSLEKYAYLLSSDSIAIHLYIGAEIKNDHINMKLETGYPHKGKFEISLKTSKPISLAIRAPDHFSSSNVNFTERNGYLHFEPKVWDEVIVLDFEIKIEVVVPDDKVEANRGHLAVQRGPFVYALQKSGVQGDTPLSHLHIRRDQEFTEKLETIRDTKYISLLTTISGVVCKFVPYFVTGNENPGEDFRIWIKESGQWTSTVKWLQSKLLW